MGLPTANENLAAYDVSILCILLQNKHRPIKVVEKQIQDI